MNSKLTTKTFIKEHPTWNAKANSRLVVLFLSNQITKSQFEFVLKHWQSKQDKFYKQAVDLFGYKD